MGGEQKYVLQYLILKLFIPSKLQHHYHNITQLCFVVLVCFDLQEIFALYF